MSSKCDFFFLYCFVSNRQKSKQSFVVHVTDIAAVLLIQQIEQCVGVNKLINACGLNFNAGSTKNLTTADFLALRSVNRENNISQSMSQVSQIFLLKAQITVKGS